MGQNATFIKLYIEDTVLVGEVSDSINSTGDIIDVSSKASGRERNVLPGRVSENISFESLANDASSDYGFAAAYTAMTDGTKVSFKIIREDASGDQVVGSQVVSGDGYITSLTKDNPDNDRSTFSGTIEIDDETTVGVYTV